jgi:hypothetical protein
MSSCSVVNKDLANEIIPKSECYSIIGPKKDIEFRDAAIMWASFYHLMFKKNKRNMFRDGLIENMQKVVNTFEQPLNYFSISRRFGFTNKLIQPQKYIGSEESIE